uniref:Probable DNA polymerase n=1 Tax=Hericium coralloides TaxID=100756 RepID=A0A1P8NNL0_HERCO|nr:hypothetical protein [Hericium coralloides]APX41110.1 hypothetical protein [Hericium coralloides]
MDLETMEFRGFQIPIAISFTYSSYNKIKTIFKIIDSSLFQSIKELDIKLDETLATPNIDIDNLEQEIEKSIDNGYIIDKAVNQLFIDFYTELSLLKRKDWIIFTHNLGSFDGYFIYKTLFEVPDIDIDNIETIVDNRNKFITINAEILNINLVWKDSIRIFPVSLNELCKVFKVDGKFMEYNKDFNNLNLFKNNDLLNQFQKYAEQDSICLFEALMKAQTIYIKKYDIDITTILSTSTLSMKIFRTKFLDTNIPTLSLNQDRIIRESYFGGATDYYKLYGENLYYYDVNSLYPYAMCNDIPLKFEKTTDSGNLNDVFGFLEVNVYCPNTVKTPFLPVKFNNQTIYPHGKWSGTYFSEELKQAVKFGYEFEVIKIHHFSKAQIFSDKITISMNNFKTLVNNEYIAANINIISDSNYKIWSKKNSNKAN